jgi:soluble lytic murein transglycosylase-like protein
MYKIVAALSVVLALVSTAVISIAGILPAPISNVVLAEKSDIIKGGQAAVVVPADLSSAQHMILNKAYEIAKADGHKNPELVQGVILQESLAGGAKSYKVAGNRGDEYFGLGQLKISAARDVMKRWPELWSKYKFQTRTDDELKANLILNQTFNIELTSKYLKLLHTDYGFNGRELMNAYNRGPAGVKAVGADWHYAIGAEKKLAVYKQQHRKI